MASENQATKWPRWKQRTVLALIIAVLLFGGMLTYLSLTAKSLNDANRISAHATFAEVVQVLGQPDETISLAGNETLYTWNLSDGTVHIAFHQNGQPTGHQWTNVGNRWSQLIQRFFRRLLP